MFRNYFFNGKSREVALVISGIHGSELSGIEVANWMCVKLLKRLQKKELPNYTTIIIPEVFPRQAEEARIFRLKLISMLEKQKKKKNKGKNEKSIDIKKAYINGRYIGGIEPSRQFPLPGDPSSSMISKTPGGDFILPETYELLRLIELVKPIRILSIHAKKEESQVKKGKDAPGIFVDPRYTFADDCVENYTYIKGTPPKKFTKKFNTNKCKFNLEIDPAFPLSKSSRKEMISARDPNGKKDDLIAFEIAKEIAKKNISLVPGNHLMDKPEVMHYSASSPPNFPGFSLGDWGPVNVEKKDDPGQRLGCPVVTVEVFEQYESWAFLNGEQFYQEDNSPIEHKVFPYNPVWHKNIWPKCDVQRSKDLQIYADALIKKFLML